MLKVYRIENAQGMGPYHAGDSFSWELCSKHGGDPLRPTIWNDVTNARMGYHCGFIDIGQYIDWFDGFFDKLTEAGYHLVEYRVHPEDIRQGKRQIMFDKLAAQRLNRYRPNLE